MRRRTLLPGLLLALSLGALSACAVNPVTGQRDLALMSEADELKLGRQAHPHILKQYGGLYDDEALQRYVGEVGKKLAARSHRSHLVYRFAVLDSEQINAFALPGGYIYITRGLLAYLNNEAELAAVLGHEIGHVTARHGVRQHAAQTLTGLGLSIASHVLLRNAPQQQELAQQALGLLGKALISGYGREHELEADRLGAEYIARSGYDARATIDVIGVLKDQEQFDRDQARREGREPRAYHGLFATHPKHDTRLQQLIAEVAAAHNAPANSDDGGRYLRRIDGLTFGPGGDQGVVRGNRFYHRGLDIALAFPPGWQVENRPDRVVASAPEGDGGLFFFVSDLQYRLTPPQFIAQQLGIAQLRDGETLRNGAYAARGPVDSPFGRVAGRVAALLRDDRAYVLIGAAQGGDERYSALFLNSMAAMRPLTANERAKAKPPHLEIVDAKRGDAFATLAADAPLPHDATNYLRLLNRRYPDGEPQPGERLKLIK